VVRGSVKIDLVLVTQTRCWSHWCYLTYRI